MENQDPRTLHRYFEELPSDAELARSIICDIIAAAMECGYLPMACSFDRPAFGGLRHALLTKNHHERCILDLSRLKVESNMKKRSKKYFISLCLDFRGVVRGCHMQHGQCWLFAPLVDAFERMQSLPDLSYSGRVVTIEVWRPLEQLTAAAHLPQPLRCIIAQSSSSSQPHFLSLGKASDALFQVAAAPCFKEGGVRLELLHTREVEGVQYALVAGELGYCVCNVYTSLTGFCVEKGSGSIQMMAMGGLLAANGFKFWDLGMELPYKIAFGCHSIPPSLPRQLWESASVSIARASQKHVCVQVPIDSCVSIAEVKEAVLELRARGAAAERIQEAMTRIKQMQAASKQLVGELQQNAES